MLNSILEVRASEETKTEKMLTVVELTLYWKEKEWTSQWENIMFICYVKENDRIESMIRDSKLGN